MSRNPRKTSSSSIFDRILSFGSDTMGRRWGLNAGEAGSGMEGAGQTVWLIVPVGQRVGPHTQQRAAPQRPHSPSQLLPAPTYSSDLTF